jgi:hypothetical protein
MGEESLLIDMHNILLIVSRVFENGMSHCSIEFDERQRSYTKHNFETEVKLMVQGFALCRRLY